jgi:hypothetical protein
MLLALLGLIGNTAQAFTAWTVNSNADPVSGTAVNCAPGNANACTLRDAIAAAAGGDTIFFAGDMTITVSSTLQIYVALTIDATNQTVAVDGNHAVGIFQVLGGAAQFTHLIVRNGNAANAGGIFVVSGNVGLTNSTLSGNHSTNNGGAIYNATGVSLTNTTLSNNSSDALGGGIYNNNGTVSLTNSTLSNNSASGGGGGIFNNHGTVNLTGSTASNNTSSFLGGAIYNNSNGSTVVLANSTMSGNSSSVGGGGIYNETGTVVLVHSTSSANSAPSGGGIFNYLAGHMLPKNSIIADGCDNTDGVVSDNGGNIDTGASCGFGVSSQSDVSAAALKLGPLQDNGGLTSTVRPGFGSAAIDAVACDPAVTTDQRGAARTRGAACDIGAVEVDADTIFVDLFETIHEPRP